MVFGKSVPLRQHAKGLRNAQKRWDAILEVVRRDSVIEGLPDYDEQSKADVLSALKAAA